MSLLDKRFGMRKAERPFSPFHNIGFHGANPAVVDRDTAIWLDAHGYEFDWPLRDKVTKARQGPDRH